MQIAVCDDQEEILKQLKNMLSRFTLVRTVYCYSDPDIFLHTLQDQTYDAVLMDIDWNRKENGLDYAARLYEASPYTKVIYMTAYGMNYMEDIFLNRTNLSGFLKKPIVPEQLEKNLQKIWDERKDSGRLLIHRQGSTLAVPFRDIWYLESSLHKTRVVLKSREYFCNERLTSMMEQLDDRFVNCHKSYIVNMEYISELQGKEILLSDPMERSGSSESDVRRIPISRARNEETRKRYFAYAAERI